MSERGGGHGSAAIVLLVGASVLAIAGRDLYVPGLLVGAIGLGVAPALAAIRWCWNWWRRVSEVGGGERMTSVANDVQKSIQEMMAPGEDAIADRAPLTTVADALALAIRIARAEYELAQSLGLDDDAAMVAFNIESRIERASRRLEVGG